MQEVGNWNFFIGSDIFGFKGLKVFYWNQNEFVLYEYLLNCGEMQLVVGGVLVVEIGIYIGCLLKDKFVVLDDNIKEIVWWDNNV